MDMHNIKLNKENLSGEDFDFFMLSFIQKKEELNNWKNKAVLGFYTMKQLDLVSNVFLQTNLISPIGVGHVLLDMEV